MTKRPISKAVRYDVNQLERGKRASIVAVYLGVMQRRILEATGRAHGDCIRPDSASSGQASPATTVSRGGIFGAVHLQVREGRRAPHSKQSA